MVPEQLPDRYAEEHFPDSQRAIPNRESIGRKPHFSFFDQGILNVCAASAFPANRDEQSLPAGWVVPDWNAYPRLFRNFVAGCAGWRRINRDLHWLDDAEQARRRATK